MFSLNFKAAAALFTLLFEGTVPNSIFPSGFYGLLHGDFLCFGRFYSPWGCLVVFLGAKSCLDVLLSKASGESSS